MRYVPIAGGFLQQLSWGQVLWGIVLALILGYTFQRAWSWEHGGKADLLFPSKYGKETYVFTAPTVFFWILLIFFLLSIWYLGVKDGLLRFGAMMADVLIWLSIYYVLLLILLPFLRRWFSARCCAIMWLVPVFLSWQGHMLFNTMPLPRLSIYVPSNIFAVIGAVWLAGFLAVGGYYIISHLLFYHRLMKRAFIEADPDICAIMADVQEEIDYWFPVKLLRADVSAPFSMGELNRTRCIVLPLRSYTPEELSMIFQHELHHLQRCDVNTKMFLCLCKAFCWFNPLVWIAVRKAADDLERSCDEIVTENMEVSRRKDYAHLLLDSAAPGRGFTTCLSAAAGTLRYRLQSILQQKKRYTGTGILMVSLFICVICFGMISISDMKGNVASMLLQPDTDIQYVFISGNQESAENPDESDHTDRSDDTDPADDPDTAEIHWNDAALRQELGRIELNHIAGIRNPGAPAPEEEHITFLLSDGRFATLTDQALIIHDYHRYNSIGDCYLVQNKVDWNALKACFSEH